MLVQVVETWQIEVLVWTVRRCLSRVDISAYEVSARIVESLKIEVSARGGGNFGSYIGCPREGVLRTLDGCPGCEIFGS